MSEKNGTQVKGFSFIVMGEMGEMGDMGDISMATKLELLFIKFTKETTDGVGCTFPDIFLERKIIWEGVFLPSNEPSRALIHKVTIKISNLFWLISASC